MKKYWIMLLSACTLAACNGSNQKISYPVAEREDVVENYFGTPVADPYRWMEDDTTARVKAWVQAENAITREYLDAIPFRQALLRRLTDLNNYEKIGVPFKKAGKYYFFRNDGLQNQSVLYVKDALDAPAEVLLDPNTLSADGTVALKGYNFSKDGRYLAYTISRSGSDWSEIYVMDLQTRRPTSDHIVWVKFSSASWYGNGFFYSTYPTPEAGKELSAVNENHMIYYHRLGDPQSRDQLVYQDKRYPKRFYSGFTDEQERFLFISEDGSNLGNRLFLRDLHKKGADYVEIASDDSKSYDVVEVSGDEFFVVTNNGAPLYKLMKGSAAKPHFSQWETVIPESDAVIESVQLIGSKLVVTYNRDASSHAYIYSRDGVLEREIALPALGSVSFSGREGDDEAFFSFSSFNFPPTIYKFNPGTGASEKYMAPLVQFLPEDYVCEQVFFPSKDGTRIPMFLTYRKDLERDGSNPVYLYGYGGFNINLTPGFSATRIPFLENGGIYASVNLRGGGEYGEAWHLAGTKMQKQNVFDDCIAAAEYLIAEKYTSADKLCLAGASNGGLLVGAVVNQRPDLFAVALPGVGVMDMLRYHKFTIGWNWASDYGTSEDSPEMFRYLYGYSPLHTIQDGGKPYPAILVTTADHDDRVVPAHSFKYTATLQAARTGDKPKLILIGTDAGHGSGKPISKVLQEQADSWGFAMWNLGMKPVFANFAPGDSVPDR